MNTDKRRSVFICGLAFSMLRFNKRFKSLKLVLTGAAAALFLTSGTLHFVRTALFAKIIPPSLPNPVLLVYISGLAELAGALGLFIPRWRRMAAWGLTLLLLAVFPANLYMATNSVQVTDQPLPQWALWARLPLQPILIAVLLWCTKLDTD